MIIGKFTRIEEPTDSGGAKVVRYEGSICTLSLNAPNVVIRPIPSTGNDKSPTHEVLFGTYRLGSGWHKLDTNNEPYISFKLDDPAFPVAIYPNLYHRDGANYELSWRRNPHS